MELPTIPEMRNDYSVIVKNLECLIDSLASKDDLSQEEYLTQFGSIAIGLIRLDAKMVQCLHKRDTTPKNNTRIHRFFRNGEYHYNLTEIFNFTTDFR